MRWTPEQLREYMEEVGRRYGIDVVNGRMMQDDDTPDPGPESRLQGKIKKWADEHGYPCQSNRQTSRARGLLTPGWPDISLILPNGRTLYVECKAAKGTMRDEQKHLRMRFMYLGHEYHLVKSFRRFLELVAIPKDEPNV